LKRRFKTGLSTAGLPTAESIDEYDFGVLLQLNEKEIMSLFDIDFILSLTLRQQLGVCIEVSGIIRLFSFCTSIAPPIFSTVGCGFLYN
jgi:hypothetical protein